MSYSNELVRKLNDEYPIVRSELNELLLDCVIQGQALPESLAREHLLHGAGRRSRVLKRSIENIFRMFPPDAEAKLPDDILADVQISLHAFVMNLYGIFENWAWAFVARHNLLEVIGDRRRVGMFLASTQRFLPKAIRDYVTSDTMTRWHTDYLKNYRDALAHRIPLYIPPAAFTQEDGVRYNELEKEKLESLRRRDVDRAEAIEADQQQIGRPAFAFVHSYSDEGASRPIYIHPQLLCDAKAVAEFGRLFLRHWHNYEAPQRG